MLTFSETSIRHQRRSEAGETMAYRTVCISNAAKLSVKNSQLIIEGENSGSVPIEDLSVLLIESQMVSCNSYLLSELAVQGVCVMFCDRKHTPCGVLTGYHQHSRQPKMLYAQLDARQPLKKQLWKRIVIEKIANQAEVLRLCGLKGWEEIALMCRKVQSGDSTNAEAAAASSYFRYLFGEFFTRRSDTATNARLNYGYSILRGVICRDLSVYGLEPCLGIHHDSKLNAFNLADDIIEPFRPVIDLCVTSMDNAADFCAEDKRALISTLNLNVLEDNQRHPVFYAITKTVQSFQKSLLSGEDCLILPRIILPELHEYE